MLGLRCCTWASSSCGERGFSLWWLLLLGSTGSSPTGFTCCFTWTGSLRLMGSRAQAQQLWHTGLAAPWRAESSQSRDQTHVPCTGRWILYPPGKSRLGFLKDCSECSGKNDLRRISCMDILQDILHLKKKIFFFFKAERS